MRAVTFTVPGSPVPAARPRFARVGNHVRTYTPSSNVQFMEQVRFAYTASYGDFLFDRGTPLLLIATFYVARPKGHYGTGRNADVLKPSAPALPTTRPDLSNLLKLFEDALNGYAFVDDSNLVDIHMRKRYGIPRTEVELAAMSSEPQAVA